jgi:predicted amidophosphoribosyltransferase
MAIGDYILCCKCEVKLIYDGDRGNREWWEERFGSEPEIMCPDCKKTKHTEQNFCPRCGKRTNDIHTCTPPQGKNT